MELGTLNDVKTCNDVVSDPPTIEARQKLTTPASTRVAWSSSPKRRRAIQKRVVEVPIKEMDGAHFNKQGEYCTNPPSDSWAWRKYGQKPIKGSPFPRGYYRCSSSKGCPAKKQVERSKSDPTILLITYSYDHNHSFPVNSRTQHKSPNPAAAPPTGQMMEPPQLPGPAAEVDPNQNGYCNLGEEKLVDLVGDMESLITADGFAWMFSTTSSEILHGSVFSRASSGAGAEVDSYFPMREEDDSLFADLGELPECSMVFGTTVDRRPCTFAAPSPSCRTTG